MVRLLIAMAPQIKGWCEELAGYGVPETLVHGDLHGGNFVLEGEHPVFFDWSDGAITHPFFDMLILMESGTAEWREETEAYLEPWRAHLSMSRLAKAFELALKVAPVYHALSYLRIIENLAPEVQWEMGDGVGFHLQKLLKAEGLYLPAE
jgi:aminoglycoside phosphotransferase (APT) family kinase protein